MRTIALTTPAADIGGTAWFGQAPAGRPLVVALHGGGFTGAYFAGGGLPEAARDAGCDVVLLDRPGYGGSRLHGRDADILTDNARAIAGAIAELWRGEGARYGGVFLVGHSIGGAIALLVAAMARRWKLVGVAVSGVGDRAPVRLGLPAEASAGLTGEAMAALFMAPGAATPAALAGMAAAAAMPVAEELSAIYGVWPGMIADVLARITAPVWMVLAQYETLWQADAPAAARLRAMASEARDEVVLWPGVGHCIDYHPQAAAFHAAMFRFLEAAIAAKAA